MPILYYGKTTPSLQKTTPFNEDALAALNYPMEAKTDFRTVAISVADGQGGTQGYPTASALVIDEMKRYFQDELHISNGYLAMDNRQIGDMLKKGTYSAHRLVQAYRQANETRFAGFAASLTTLLLAEQKNKEYRFYASHVGDAQAYLIRPNQAILSLLTPHTEAYTAFLNKQITQDEILTHPGVRTLTQVLGPNLGNPQSLSGTLYPGDIILLVTAGVHLLVTPEELQAIVQEGAETTEGLIDRILKAVEIRGSYFDATAILAMML